MPTILVTNSRKFALYREIRPKQKRPTFRIVVLANPREGDEWTLEDVREFLDPKRTRSGVFSYSWRFRTSCKTIDRLFTMLLLKFP